jgi:hypothetical protein
MLNRGPARLARSTGAASGVLVVLLGAWGALIPFVGPYFGYGFGTHAAWHYSANRLWLDILPGALAVAAGLLMISAATRRAGVLAGWLGLAAGAWFAVGPAVSLTWHAAGNPIGAPLGGDVRHAFEQIGFFYGLGALAVALVAFAGGRFASRPALEPYDAFAMAPPVAPAAPADTVVASGSDAHLRQPEAASQAPARRRSAFRRRGRSSVG